ncbi:MAG: DNRLRE domain-containing protein, partial [bacterium]|nr:DNRLRE domain-containing protein [bacterium]
FSRFSVLGDRIRWADVFPDVDFEVRYINDIMKVDVIVKKNRLDAIKSAASGEFLTAKFDIPGVSILGEARQGGQPRDLYADALDVSQSALEFYRNGKRLHYVKPVDAYFVDDVGEEIKKDGMNLIQSYQKWILEEDGKGNAEISISLDGIKETNGEAFVIDPPMTFDSGGYMQDTLIDYENQYTTYYNNSVVSLSREDRFLVKFDVGDALAGLNILGATLSLNTRYIDLQGNTYNIRAYKVTNSWSDYYTNWFYRSYGPTWGTPGGDFEASKYVSRPKAIDESMENQEVVIDVSQIFKSHYSSDIYSVGTNGFLVKRENSDGLVSRYIEFKTSEYTTTNERPVLTVEYEATQFGADNGNGYDVGTTFTVNQRMSNQTTDKLFVSRYFAGVEDQGYPFFHYLWYAESNGIKVVPVFPIKNIHSASTAAQFTDYVMGVLNYHNPNDPNYASVRKYMNNGTIIGVEIGNEEEGDWWNGTGDLTGSTGSRPGDWFGDMDDGADFAEYYIAVRNAIKAQWPNMVIYSGGSVENHSSLDANPNNGHGTVTEFMKGFVSKIRTDHDVSMLPETLSIHLYTGHWNPEYRDGTGVSEMKNRLSQLHAICNQYGYFPNFACTEYGFSPEANYVYGPLTNQLSDEIAPSEYTQAVYYLRSTLIFSTMQYLNGIGWEKNYYFQHAWNEHQTGFHGQPSGGIIDCGPDRDVRYLSRKLYGDNEINIDADDNKIWIPFTTIPPTGPGDYLAYCGWSNAAETTYWLAIWRYNQRERYYRPISGSQRSVAVTDNFVDGFTRSVHQFDFSQQPNDVFATLGSGLMSASWNSPLTQITVSGVTENPTFVKFVKN